MIGWKRQSNWSMKKHKIFLIAPLFLKPNDTPGQFMLILTIESQNGSTMDAPRLRQTLQRNGILLPKLFLPIVRKNCSSDREKILKFEAEGREFAKILKSLEQFIQTVKGQKNFW